MAGSGGFRPSLVRSGNGIDEYASVLASEHGYSKRAGITLDASKVAADANGNKIVKHGTVLFEDDETGKWEPHVVGSGDLTGLNPEQVGILVDSSINLRDGDVITGVALHASVLAARVPNLDAAARTALAGRVVFQ